MEPPEVRAARTGRLAAFDEPWVFGIAEGGTRAFVEGRGLELISDRNAVELFPQHVGREIPDQFRGRAPGFRMAVARVP